MTLPNSSSINAYGSGVLVDAVPLVDPTSEIGAAALNPLRNDVAAMTTVSPRLIFQYQASATSPAVVSSATWTAGNDSVWGNANANLPIITRNSTGFYTVQLPSTVSDQIGNSNLVNIRYAKCFLIDDSGTVPAIVTCTVISASTFRIKQYLAAGSLSDFAGSLFVVEVF